MQGAIDKYPPINPYANTRWSGGPSSTRYDIMKFDPNVSWNPSAVRPMHWDPTENWNSGIPESSLYAMEMRKSRPFGFYDQLTYEHPSTSGSRDRRASKRAGKRASTRGRKRIHRRGRSRRRH